MFGISRLLVTIWTMGMVIADVRFYSNSMAQDVQGKPISPLFKLERNELDQTSQRTLPKEIVAVLGSNRGRHANCVKCVALSPDERYLASGSRSDSVRVWDPHTMFELRSFPHPDDVDLVWFSKDSRFLHTTCWDGWLRTYDLESKSVEPIAFHVDDSQFVARHFNEGSRVWVTNTVIHGGRLPQLVELEWLDRQWKKTGRVRIGFAHLNPGTESIAVSADGRWLATRNYLRVKNADPETPKRRIAIWDLLNKEVKPSREIEFEGTGVEIMQFDSTAKNLLYADSNQGVGVISLDNNSEQQLRLSEKYQARCICLTPDEKQLLVGDYGGKIHSWNWNNGSPEFISSTEAHDDWVSEVTFNKNQSRMYSAGWDHVIHAWDRVDGHWKRNELLGHHHSVTAVAISSDGGWMATGSSTKMGMGKVSNDVFLWRVEGSHPKLSRILSGCVQNIMGLAFSRDGSYLAAAHDLGIQVWDLSSNDEGKLIQRTFQDEDRKKTLWGQSVAFLGHSHRIISGWNEGMVALHEVDSIPPRELDACKVPFHYVENLAVSQSGKRAYASSIPIDIVGDSLRLESSPELTSGEKRNKNSQPDRVGNFDVYRPTLPSFIRVAIRDDAMVIVGADKKNGITIVSLSGDKTTKVVIANAHDTRIEAVVVNHEGLIASGDWDGIVRVRSLDTPNEIRNQWQLGRVWCMALAPDQQHIAIGTGTGLTYLLRLGE